MEYEIIRVSVVDKNVAWREAIGTLLACQPDIEVIGTSPNLAEAVQGICQDKPDVVLIDRLSSSQNERAMVDKLRHMFPHICFVLHSNLRHEATVADLIDAGVTNRLPKGSSPGKIVQAVREACHNQVESQEANSKSGQASTS